MKYFIKSIAEDSPRSREFDFPRIKDAKTREHVESVVKNNPARYLTRGLAQLASGALGTPGNIAALAESGANYLYKKAKGKDTPIHEAVQKYIPSSSNLIKGAEKISGLNLGGSPEDETTLDRALSATGGLVAAGAPLGQAAKMAAAGQVGKKVAQVAGLGQTGQTIADIGASFIAGNFKPSTFKQAAKKDKHLARILRKKVTPQEKSVGKEIADTFIKKGIASGLGYILGGNIGSVAAPALMYGLESAYKKSAQLRKSLKNPDALSHFQKAVGSLLIDNKPLAIQSLQNLQRTTQPEKMRKKFTVISV